MLPYILLTAGLAAGGYYAKTQHEKNVPSKGQMTPERTVIFETALAQVKDSGKLRALATAYRKEGLTKEADILEKRAKIRDLPPEQKEARRQAFRKGMDAKDPIKVENLAKAFDEAGATGAADALRKYAEGLRAQYKDATPDPALAPTPAT
jgi:hypothetical protein